MLAKRDLYDERMPSDEWQPSPLIDAVRPEWQTHAACRDQGLTNTFFPEHDPKQNRSVNNSAMQRQAKEAQAICEGCTVRQECLDYALLSNEKYGVWGGVTVRGRRGLRPGRVA